MGHGGGIRQIIDGDYFHIGILEGGTEYHATDSTETVDA
jgi:hypothetical protein